MFDVQIVLLNPKSPTNVGGAMRAAGCYGVSKVWYTGNRYGHAKRFVTDTQQRTEEIPLQKTNDVQTLIHSDAKVIAVELIDGATALPKFNHPDNAIYVFGPEDGTVDKEVLAHCNDVVYVPTKGCMNLAATVNVLLYDRLAKSTETNYTRDFLLNNRDKNNRAQFKK
jgi:tRNA(Leu) C34 or U34 (ribose-2'-O)-methylase TrmL